MKTGTYFFLVLALLCLADAAHSQDRGAIVRIVSHGVTGTVIASGQGWSDILSAGHGWYMVDSKGQVSDHRRDKIVIDVPVEEGKQGPTPSGSPYLLGVDPESDLALVRLPAGPLPVIPLAGANYRLGRNVASCGYDEMKWQNGPLVKRATVLQDQGGVIWTKEIPWHGRSGGPLVDTDANVLIGVVEGYEFDKGMDGRTRYGDGMYVNTARVRAFVARYAVKQAAGAPVAQQDPWQYDPRNGGYYRGMTPGAAPPPPPGTSPIRVDEKRDLICPCPGGVCPCPGGTCPQNCPNGTCQPGPFQTGRQ